MRRFIHGLNPNDTFTIIDFSDTATKLSEKPLSNTPKNIATAINYINQLDANGGTRMLNGIQKVLNFPSPSAGRLRSIVMLTDGYIGNEKAILAELQEKLKPGNRLYSFGVGSSVNRYLINRLAEIGRGIARVVRQDEPTEEVAEKFFQQINNPVLTQIEINWNGKGEAPEIYPVAIPDLFAEQPLVLFGRKQDAVAGELQVNGIGAGGEIYQQSFPINFAESGNVAVAQLWGRQKIKHLTNQMFDYEKKSMVDKVTETALSYQLLSEYTAFVAVSEEVRVEPGSKSISMEVPVEMPEGVSYEGIFGAAVAQPMAAGFSGRGVMPENALSGRSMKMSAPISSSSSRGVSSVNYSYQRKAEKHHILSLHSGFFDNAELEDAEDELALEDIAQSISSISEDDFGFKSAELKDVAELKDAEDELALEDIAQSISEVDLFFENAELKDAWDELVVEDIAQSISAAEESPIIKAVNVILIKALTEGVSDIHVEPQKEFVRIRMGKDGVLRNYYRLPKKLTPAITSRFKIIAHLDIAEKQQAQSGRMRKVFKGRTIHFQVNSFPGSYGEKIVLRIEDAEDEDIAESISAAKDARITKTVKVILVKALTEGVSDIHVEPQKEFIRIRMGKDGVLRNYYRLPKKLTPAITTCFKILAHLDIAEKQQAQSGRMRKVFKGRTIHFQVNSFPGSYGEKIVLQILDSSSIDTDTPLQLIQTIGLDAAGQKNLQQYLQNVNIPSNINCEIVLELQVKGKRILRVILDDKTSTLKDKKVLAEIKRSLLKWRVPSGAANKILITIKVSS